MNPPTTGTPQHGADRAPPPDFATWNETMVERYDIEAYYERSHPIVRWIEARRLRALIELAAPRAGDRLLEVGCGAGFVLERFPSFERTAIDLSPSMLERTRRRLGGTIRLARSAAEGLPFADASFDIVLCTEVLEHTVDPSAVVGELMRVARPGARVIVSIPNEANIDRVKRALRRVPVLRSLLRTLAAEGNEWHLHEFDLARLRATVSGHAAIARLRGIPGGFMPIRYVAALAAPAGKEVHP